MKHKHHDVIMAYASGQQIQYKTDVNWFDVAGSEAPNFETAGVKWRIKPEIIKYRVALFRHEGRGFLFTKTEDYKNIPLEHSAGFMKYLTDWIECER